KSKMLFRLFLILLTCVSLLAKHSHRGQKKDKKFHRIIGGINENVARSPWQVSLQWKGRHICGGAIYSLTLVLTAAHCVVNKTANCMQVHVGSSYPYRGGSFHSVNAHFAHEKYSQKRLTHDIAVIQLATPLKLTYRVQPIKLATEAPPPGSKVWVSGFGLTNLSQPSARLLGAEVQIVQQKSCIAVYNSRKITEVALCAYADDKDACRGDSGGPLVYKRTLVGLVSWGKGCARRNHPGVYSNVSVLRPWVLNTTQKLMADTSPSNRSS
ncbi:hypothetical protein KR222_011479, partial [Zaprionus bogoriensis]